ncbi:TetR/AcrR family transcriptional regulator [Nakamurella silvestris]|nr:TetR/AcrR family transcriptional regulator [Nakamurella silvestris]
MPTDGPGSANPARTLGLLWGPQDRTGRSGLSIRAIVDAAVDLADTQGMDAVSMRQVAEKLGVGTMSLYTHVPGKTELTELMSDRALADLYRDVDEPRSQGDWRSGMTFVAHRNWDLYLRHPWLLELLGFRPVVGPHLSDKYEAELRPLDGIGLSDVEMDSALTLVLTHVEGAARAHQAQIGARQESGRTDAQWWVQVGPILEKVMDTDRFPVSGRVGSAAGQAHQAPGDPRHMLDFGLARILDGVHGLIGNRG